MMLRLAMVQMNAVVGDLEGNTRTICGWIREARKAKADVVVFPELAVCGYPPEDLLLMPQFLFDISRMQDRIAKVTTGIMAVVGSVMESDRPAQHPIRDSGHDRRKPLNAAWVLVNGQVKRRMPNASSPIMGCLMKNDIFNRDEPVRSTAWVRYELESIFVRIYGLPMVRPAGKQRMVALIWSSTSMPPLITSGKPKIVNGC